MKLLCAADLHLGRTSSRLPDEAEPAQFSSASALQRLVQHAIQQRVDAVLLAGDVVDRENRFFEAVGPLQQGISALSRAGIPTIAITGNHDFDVLEGVTAQFGEEIDFTLLGLGGKWQRHALRDSRGDVRLYIDGWSFANEHVSQSPLDSYDLLLPTDAPLVGMVHGDLDQPRSTYAPLASAGLQSVRAAFWLLGHIHQPMLRAAVSGDPAVIYPGSPQALDPGELGQHGAMLVELAQGQPAAITRLPLSTARYERWAISVEGCEDQSELKPLILSSILEKAGELSRADHVCELLSLRITLTGETPLSGRMFDAFGQIDELRAPVGSMQVVVETVNDATSPPIDLSELAKGKGPVATLAGWIAQLDDPRASPSPELAELLEAASHKARGVYDQPHYQGIDPAGEGGVAQAGAQTPRDSKNTVRQQMLLLMQQLRAEENSQQPSRRSG